MYKYRILLLFLGKVLSRGGVSCPQQKIFSAWHGPCRVDLADKLGMVLDWPAGKRSFELGTVVAGRDLHNKGAALAWVGSVVPRSIDPRRIALTCLLVCT